MDHSNLSKEGEKYTGIINSKSRDQNNICKYSFTVFVNASSIFQFKLMNKYLIHSFI